MIDNLKISVITPSYNSAAVIERAIKSVLAQDYRNYEHVVVDGGSTDGTVNILRKYDHLKWVSERDRGQVDALNKGFTMSTGDIIVYLNADDHFCEGAFSAVIPHFAKGERMVVGKVLVRTERAEGVREWINDPKVDFVSMLRHWEPNAFCVNPIGYFYRRELQDEIGKFNEENDARHDLEFLLELSLRCKAKKIDKVLGIFNHSFDTKTGLSQLKPSSWNIDSRPFIDRLALHLPPAQFKKFQLDRERGYQLRRQWTIKECFSRGMAQQLIDEGEIMFLPKSECESLTNRNSAAGKDRPVAKGDWIIALLATCESGGQSIYNSLTKLPVQVLSAPVYCVSSIGKSKLFEDSSLRNPGSLGSALRSIFDNHGSDLKWKFISSVRDPLTCLLQPMLATSQHEIDRIRSDVKDDVKYQLDYFDNEYKAALGVDVYEYPFDHNKGYVIIKKGNIEILIYRFDDLPRIYDQAMEEFLGISELKLPRLHIVSEMKLSAAYNDVKQAGFMNTQLLEDIYASRMVRHFFTRQEIDNFYNRWINANSPQTNNKHLQLFRVARKVSSFIRRTKE